MYKSGCDRSCERGREAAQAASDEDVGLNERN